jgi:hypothetical protein
MQKHLNDNDKDSLTFILEQSDLVKFAKYIPNSATIKQLKEQSEQFIQETKIILKEENTSPQELENAPAEKTMQNNIQEEKGD